MTKPKISCTKVSKVPADNTKYRFLTHEYYLKINSQNHQVCKKYFFCIWKIKQVYRKCGFKNEFQYSRHSSR